MVIASAHRAGDPCSSPGTGRNFSLKLLIDFKLFRQSIAENMALKKSIERG